MNTPAIVAVGGVVVVVVVALVMYQRQQAAAAAAARAANPWNQIGSGVGALIGGIGSLASGGGGTTR